MTPSTLTRGGGSLIPILKVGVMSSFHNARRSFHRGCYDVQLTKILGHPRIPSGGVRISTSLRPPPQSYQFFWSCTLRKLISRPLHQNYKKPKPSNIVLNQEAPKAGNFINVDPFSNMSFRQISTSTNQRTFHADFSIKL